MGGEVDIPALVGGGYGAFWNCRKRYRAVKGGKASKKSCTAALWYIYHLMRLPGANLLVVRAVQRTHRTAPSPSCGGPSGGWGWSICGARRSSR